MHFPCDSALPLLECTQLKMSILILVDMYKNVHNSIIQNSQDQNQFKCPSTEEEIIIYDIIIQSIMYSRENYCDVQQHGHVSDMLFERKPEIVYTQKQAKLIWGARLLMCQRWAFSINSWSYTLDSQTLLCYTFLKYILKANVFIHDVLGNILTIEFYCKIIGFKPTFSLGPQCCFL